MLHTNLAHGGFTEIPLFVLSGRYEEKNLKVGRKKWNLMFVGDGKGKTVISGGKSIFDNVTTFHTASFGNKSINLTFIYLFIYLLHLLPLFKF